MVSPKSNDCGNYGIKRIDVFVTGHEVRNRGEKPFACYKVEVTTESYKRYTLTKRWNDLRVCDEALRKAVTVRTIEVRGTTTEIPLKAAEAPETAAAFAMAVSSLPSTVCTPSVSSRIVRGTSARAPRFTSARPSSRPSDTDVPPPSSPYRDDAME